MKKQEGEIVAVDNEGVETIRKIVIENTEAKRDSIIRMVGISMGSNKDKCAEFKSVPKSLCLYNMNDNQAYQFQNHLYLTDKRKEIEFIKSSAAFGKDVFFQEYPDWVNDKFAEDARYLTRDKDEHEPGAKLI